MKVSIIIPVYNASLTLNECLGAIFDSSFKDFEVIVVSDNSSDNSVEIAKTYNCKILELKENRGPSFARNKGAEIAESDILLFLDSDIILKKNSLSLIIDKFSSKEINALQGIYSHETNYKYLATQFYQSYISYYTWPKNIKYASTLVTACFALRKEVFAQCNGFDTKITHVSCEDEQFGYQLIDKGYKILILRDLEVIHRVNYTTKRFIKKRFTQDVDRIKFYLREKTYIKKIKQKNYFKVISGIFILGLIFLTIVSSIFFPNKNLWYIFLILNISYILLHIGFLRFVSKTKGFNKIFGVLAMFYLDTSIMLTGMSYGFLEYFLFNKKH